MSSTDIDNFIIAAFIAGLQAGKCNAAINGNYKDENKEKCESVENRIA